MATAATQTRRNRTITVDFHDETTYDHLLHDGKAFLECLLAFLLSLGCSHSRRRRMLLKINDLFHLAFVNIKSIESTTYAFYAVSNAANFVLTL